MRQKREKGHLVVAVACLALYLAVMAGAFQLITGFYDRVHGAGGTAYTMESSVWLIAVAVPTMLFLFLMCHEIMILVRDGRDENGEPEQSLDAKQMVGITAVFLTLLIVANLLGSMTAEVYSTEKLKKSIPRKSLYYEWNDVDYYSFEAVDGGLEMEIVMNDGRAMTYGNSWFGLNNDAFAEQFPEDIYDYMPWLTEQIGKKKLAADFDWEALRQAVNEDYALELAEELQRICEG